MPNSLFIVFLMLSSCWCTSQTTAAASKKQDINDLIINADSMVTAYDANRPSRAAFYSAVLPGLGQIYNKKYWKLPIVYAALGGSVAVYIQNDRQYNELREAYKIRLAGGTNDQYSREDGSAIISTAGLERAQQVSQRNKELSLLVTALFYVLQVIDANVNGHLDQFNVERDLSIVPYMDYSPAALVAPSYGIGISYKF
jgi:hypothetical protein